VLGTDDRIDEAAAALPGWGTANAGGGGPAVIEAIKSGVYALCLASPAEVALTALWRGVLPSDRCRRGSVEYGRTLTLSPP
jgi:hypothetical protein